MFDEALNQRFSALEADLKQTLYRRYTLDRELGELEEKLLRLEVALAELERVRGNWATEKAISEAQTTEQGGHHDATD